jgi:phosphatidylglycerophosphatase A
MIKEFLLTGFYLGKLPKMPGTYTSIATAGILYVLSLLNCYFCILLMIYGLFVFGVRAIDEYERKHNIHDAPETSIDEVIGMLIAGALAYPFFDVGRPFILGVEILILLILFRIFDILKPGIIGYIDKNVKGGFGVIADDVIAGIYASFYFALLCFFKIIF